MNTCSSVTPRRSVGATDPAADEIEKRFRSAMLTLALKKAFSGAVIGGVVGTLASKETQALSIGTMASAGALGDAVVTNEPFEVAAHRFGWTLGAMCAGAAASWGASKLGLRNNTAIGIVGGAASTSILAWKMYSDVDGFIEAARASEWLPQTFPSVTPSLPSLPQVPLPGISV